MCRAFARFHWSGGPASAAGSGVQRRRGTRSDPGDLTFANNLRHADLRTVGSVNLAVLPGSEITQDRSPGKPTILHGPAGDSWRPKLARQCGRFRTAVSQFGGADIAPNLSSFDVEAIMQRLNALLKVLPKIQDTADGGTEAATVARSRLGRS